ncbi:MAG: DUF58 domain-containing protein [Zetaproteobacteria bacterium CG12_big_fil_rev_8_21_14_0_65_54_13]|nr:MAG: DUF58 domain-containing protein [Zetaproteobacteria bacterium CG12_big_fil_rev_8_21_14_0_65_54_13]PIX55748.1 MAG: DUF58 domain-containing protein [Zetaproteobacteria bacterium CG_4_10_14_3_um_filter_54_28]PJA30560.1 MAG: DUF58 domain-containing protein [Zetaproteobacteria bacterium CG_4_9_14_3_um_filter_54_145]
MPELSYLIHLQRPAAGLHLREGYPRARMAGAHLSRFQGRGIEFDEVRPYQAGDDIRGMDWRVTARTGKPHTKLFREERERPAMLLLDMRPAMFFATRGALKSVVAAECASLLAWSILHQGDRVGSMIFDASGDGAMRPARPVRGKRAVMRMLGNVLAHPYWQQRPTAACDSLLGTLQRADHVTPAGSLMMLVSDGRGLDDASEAMLMRLLAHHSILFVFIYDAFEREMGDAGMLYASDGTAMQQIDSSKSAQRSQHAARFHQRRAVLKRLEQRPGFVLIECATDDDPAAVLARRLGRGR